MKPPSLTYTGQTSSGLKLIIYVFKSLCGRFEKHKVPTNGPYNWSPELIFGATCTILWAGAVPGLPGPRGAESRPKTRGRIYRDPWSVQHTLLQSQEDDGRQVSLPLPAGRGEA